MAEPTIQLGGGNWAGKSGNLLGYYEQNKKFYAEDFTFSRSTTGTYTDSDGYIQEMPYNLLQQSNNFDTTWTTTNATVLGGQSGIYDSSNAWKLSETTANSVHILRQSTTSVSNYTFSVYLKNGTKNKVMLFDGDNNDGAKFNLETQSLHSYYSSEIDYKIEILSNGWARYSISPLNTSTNFRIYMLDDNYNLSYAGNINNYIYIQNAQLVKGTSAKTYFPTTTRLNMPRVDYLNNSNGSLILEPQRTNLVTHSSDFSGGWALDDATKVSNSTASPDGTVNAITLIGNTNASRHHISKAAAGSVTASLSVFAKAKELRYLQIASANTTSQYVNFDVSDGTIGTVGSSFTDAKIEDYGNGWYRCSVTSTNQYNNMYISLVSSLTSSWLESWTMSNNTDGLYLYGAQLEQGSYATTLINTLGSSVTRNADACSLTNIADRIGQTEGSVFLDITRDSLESYTQRVLTLSNGTTNNVIGLQLTADNQITFYVENGGSNQVVITKSNATTANVNVKIAAAYKENDFVLYIDGTQVGVDTSGSVPTTSVIKYANPSGSLQYVGVVNNFKLYNTRLSNSELATLTTL